MGPIISTGLHLIILILLSLYQGELKPKASEVSVIVQKDAQLDEFVPLKEPEKDLEQDQPELPPLDPEYTSSTPENTKLDKLKVDINEPLESVEAPGPLVNNFSPDVKPSSFPQVNKNMYARSSDFTRAKAVGIGGGTTVTGDLSKRVKLVSS